MMPRVQPKLARPEKRQEEGHRRGRKASTKRAGASGDASGSDRNELKFEEAIQTFVRKLMEAKITTPVVKNAESSGGRKERRKVRGLTQLGEKAEDSSTGEDADSLSSRRKPGVRRRSWNRPPTHSGGHRKTHPPRHPVRKTTRGPSSRDMGQSGLKVPGDLLQGEAGERESAKEEKAVKESQLSAEGATLTLAADFSSATLAVSRQWGHIFSILGENGFDPKFLCKVELAFKCDGRVQTFSDLQSLRRFASRRAFMRDLLQDVFPQSTNPGEGRHRAVQREGENSLRASECGAGDPASGGFNLLFIKEVKVARAEAGSSASSEWEGKGSPTVGEQEDSWLEEEEEESSVEEEQEEGSWGEEEESSGEEEWEEGSLGEEETSETDQEGEGDSEMKEQEWGGSPSAEGEGAPVLREELACSEEEEGPVQTREDHEADKEEETAAPRGQGIEVLRPPSSHGNARSTSLEHGSNEHQTSSQANLSASAEAAELSGRTEEERSKTLQTNELTSREAALIQETEESFRRSVVGIFREIREEMENIRKCCPDVEGLQHSVDDLHCRVAQLEETASRLDSQVEEASRDAAQMSRQLLNNEKLRIREDEFRSSNVRVIGVPEKDNKANDAEDIIKEIIEDNFPELSRGSRLEVLSAQRVPSKLDERRLTPRHILVTFWSPSEREMILKASREREVSYRGTCLRLTADFSLSTLDARSQWCDIVRVLHENGFHPRIRYPARLTFDFEDKTRTFFDIDEFRRFVGHVPSLKALLEKVL